MCLVVIALDAVPRYPLVIAANRDEQHARPTEPAGWWPAQPRIFAGRDLLAGGTWLGADRFGRIAAVTNIRDGSSREAARSRGALVAEYLADDEPASDYAQRVAASGSDYAAFNLLLVDGGQLRYASNRAPLAELGTGVHALSNAPYGTDWPKMSSARAGVRALLQRPGTPLDALFSLLAERDAPTSPEERYRTAHFIVGPVYGTRCSTIVLIDDEGLLTFAERSFDASGQFRSEVREQFALTQQA